MEYNSIKERTIKFVNNMIYTGNNKSRNIGSARKLGINKIADSLPPEVKPYQILLNIISLYVCRQKGKTAIRADDVISLSKLQIVKERFDEWYGCELKSPLGAFNPENTEKLKKSYLSIQKSMRNNFPELEEKLIDG